MVARVRAFRKVPGPENGAPAIVHIKNGILLFSGLHCFCWEACFNGSFSYTANNLLLIVHCFQQIRYGKSNGIVQIHVLWVHESNDGPLTVNCSVLCMERHMFHSQNKNQRRHDTYLCPSSSRKLFVFFRTFYSFGFLVFGLSENSVSTTQTLWTFLPNTMEPIKAKLWVPLTR